MLSDIPLFAAMAAFLYIAVRDFQTLRIRNVDVIAVLVLFAIYAALGGPRELVPDLAAGGLLFALTFVLWLFNTIGAGDVKLYLPLGFFVGFSGLLPYTVFLLLFSLIILGLIKIGGRFSKGRTAFTRRLVELREEGKVPYGVPMAAAAVTVMAAERALGI